MNQENITGILLAGGKSKRMGRDKGLIPVGDSLLYQFPLRVLESICHKILISTSKPFHIKETHEQVTDTNAGIGPMSGLLTCLQHSETTINLVVPYDLPYVNKELFLHLLEHLEGYDVVVPAKVPGKPESLCGIFRKSLLPVIREMILEKNYAIHQLLTRVNTNILPVNDALPFYHNKLFSNVNSPADLQEILRDMG